MVNISSNKAVCSLIKVFSLALLITAGVGAFAPNGFAGTLPSSNAPPLVNGWVQVSTPKQLEYVDQHQSSDISTGSHTTYLDANIELMNDIDLTGYSGWVPIGGNSLAPFSGVFNGQGFTIQNLTVNNLMVSQTGFFGVTTGTVENVGVVDASVTGPDFPSSSFQVGGLVGMQKSGVIRNVYVTGLVQNFSFSGGNDFMASVGGLVGDIDGGLIQNAYATARVTQGTDDYLTGGAERFGGLVGLISGGTIRNVYAAGRVSTGSRTQYYGTSVDFGGLVGELASGTINHSYFDTDVTGQSSGVGNNSSASGVTGATTTVMQLKSTFTSAGWDFINTWGLTTGYPYLKQPTVVLAGGSQGVAGDLEITNLTTDEEYTVVVGTGSDATIEYVKSNGTLSLSPSDLAPIMNTSITGLTNGTTYDVQAYRPTPTGLTHHNVTQTGWLESWAPVAGVSSYNVFLDGAKIGSTVQNVYSYSFTGEKPGTTYRVQISSTNGAGHESAKSSPDSVTTAVYGGGGPVPPDIITDSFTEPGQVGQSYTAHVIEIGGNNPMTWQVSTGTLPPGLSINDQGVISGTPSKTGVFTFTVKVTDVNHLSSMKQLTLKIKETTSPIGGDSAATGGAGTPTPPKIPVSVTTSKEQTDTIGHLIHINLQAKGGKMPYAWSVLGVLPKGLSVNSNTGVISGTPETPGIYRVPVKVVGANGTVSEETLTVDVVLPYEREVLWNDVVKNIPAIVRKDGSTETTYMPIWYVMQWLKPIGIQSTWDGKDWHITTSVQPDLSNIKSGSGDTSIYLDGTMVQKVNTVAQYDPSTNKPTTYMPIWYVMQLLKRVGLQSRWNGTTWTVTK